MTDVPVIIRNQRPRKWPAIAMRACILGTAGSCAAALLIPMASAPWTFFMLMAISMVGTFTAGFCIAVYSVFSPAVDKLVLGDVLEIWPGWVRFAIEDIRQIEFVSGPEEDFGEMGTVSESQTVQIVARRRVSVCRLRVALSSFDLGRLREWMVDKGIATNGMDGRRGD
jgi:hypothetical protein